MGGKVESVTDFFFLGSKITVDCDYRHEVKCLFLGRKAMTNLHSILKSRKIPLPTKVRRVKAMVFSVVKYHKKGWASKNWCFWIVMLEKALESPLDCKEIKPVNPKGNQPDYSLEGLMLKLKLQYFGHLMWSTNSFKKTQMLGKVEFRGEVGDRGWDGWMVSLTQWTWVWANSRRWWRTAKPVLQSMGLQRVGHGLATEKQLNFHHPPHNLGNLCVNASEFIF